MRRLRNTINIFKTLSISWDRLFGPWLLTQFTTCFPVQSWAWIVFPRTKTTRSHKSRAGIPSNLFSDSFELCETEVCFLHIQLAGTNVWPPTIHNVTPKKDFESSRSPAKLESWNCPQPALFAVLSPQKCCLYAHFSKLRSILVLIVQVCSLAIEYQIFQYVSSTSISEQFVSILVTISTQISLLFFLKWWTSIHRVDTF